MASIFIFLLHAAEKHLPMFLGTAIRLLHKKPFARSGGYRCDEIT